MKNHGKTFTQVSQQKSKRKMIEQGLNVVAGVDLRDAHPFPIGRPTRAIIEPCAFWSPCSF